MASGCNGVTDTKPRSSVKSRVIVQQCMSAKLMVQPKTETQDEDHVEIGRGLIVYVCFLKGASDDILGNIVQSVLGARLSKTENGKLVSILDLPGDILIIPQSTLGGNLKGKRMQYHNNINKDDGLKLYTKFVQICQEVVAQSNRCKEKQTVVGYGTYGIRKEELEFSAQNNGPYSHVLEF